MSIGISIDATTANARLASLRDAMAPRRINRAGAFGVASLVRRYLAARDAEYPNKLGGERTHFYANAAKAVNIQPGSGESSVVAISATGFAQRYFGGTIKAVNGRFLTIPLTPAAYGHTISEFTKPPSTKSTSSTPRRKASPSSKFVVSFNEGLVKFLLVAQVTQAADPTVLPSDADLQDAASMAIDNMLYRAAGRPDLVRQPGVIDLTPAYKPNAFSQYDEES